MTWFARSAGWYKVKKSKNWYCLKCVRANQWEVAPQSESSEQYLCAQCRARASHLYDVDLASPPQPSGSCSSASVAPATSATHAGVSAVATGSYSGPVARPLMQDPHTSVHFMKPLQTLVGAYSPFALRYMQDKCHCSVEDLQARARDRDAYESGARGLPLQASPWSVTRRDVVDADTGISSRVISVPGLIASDEAYPTKRDFNEKWRRDLSEVFVGAGSLDADASSSSAAGHWRCDFLEQLLKFNDLQGRPLPPALDCLTVLQWNAGGTRQRLDVGQLTGGSLHFGSMQEVDADIVSSLERWGAVVHSSDAHGQATCTFARADFVRRSELLFSKVLTRAARHHGEVFDSWLLCAPQSSRAFLRCRFS